MGYQKPHRIQEPVSAEDIDANFDAIMAALNRLSRGDITFETTPGGGGSIVFDNVAPTTSKGDLIVHNGADNVRLPVGTDGQVLTADSAAAEGVAWKTSTGGGDIGESLMLMGA